MTVDTREFEEAVGRLEFLFFAGSGVSFASGMPSAEDVLRETLRRYLSPDGHARLRDALFDGSTSSPADLAASFQPEVFYEQLLLLTDASCLAGWNVLHAPAPPNLNHLFLVAYAHASRTPLITTNFDLLFERAAWQLGLDPVSYVPGVDREHLLHLTPSRDQVLLWKAHGTIDTSAPTSEPALLTTMESISRVNFPLLEALRTRVQGRKLCFVGYSGNDIDLFPEMRRMNPNVHWVDANLSPAASTRMSESMRPRAAAINATVTPLWPAPIFEALANKRGMLPGDVPVDVAKVEHVSNAFRSTFRLVDAFDQAFHGIPRPDWTPQHERLLEVLLLRAKGRYAIAHDRLTALRASGGSLSPQQWNLSTYLLSQLSHERSRYVDSERHARAGLEVVSRSPADPECRAFGIIFRCFIAESRRMQFAHNLGPCPPFMPSPWHMFRALWSLLEVAIRVPSRIETTGPVQLTRLKILRLYAEFERIEHDIRLAAFPPISLLPWLFSRGRRTLPAPWAELDHRSKAAGYAAGIANVRKFVARIPGNADERNEVLAEGKDIYGLIQSATGGELSLLNVSHIAIQARDFSSAEAAAAAALESARSSGNMLNGVKAYVAISAVRRLDARARPWLTDEEAEELQLMAEQVQGSDWRRVFARMIPGLR